MRRGRMRSIGSVSAMPLPDGLRQDGEGITRCLTCSGEVIQCRGQDGAVVWVTPVRGEVHSCKAWEEMLESVTEGDG